MSRGTGNSASAMAKFVVLRPRILGSGLCIDISRPFLVSFVGSQRNERQQEQQEKRAAKSAKVAIHGGAGKT